MSEPKVTLSATMVICTYNRPESLAQTLESILLQTRLPSQMIIVDDGDLKEFPLWQKFEDKQIEWCFLTKDTPGLPESRQESMKVAWGDVILFTDDDLTLEAHYIEEIMKVYEEDREGYIAGVGGKDENAPPLKLSEHLRFWWDRVFLVSGKHEGRILKSGFCAEYYKTPYPITGPVGVDIIAGLTMSFRREILKNFRFTPGYHAYALDEDKDITYRVSREHKLVTITSAKLYHDESQQMRPNLRNISHRFLRGRYIFFYNYMHQRPYDWMFFWWAVFGYSLFRLLVALLTWKPDAWSRVKGIGDFFKEAWAGKTFDGPIKYGNMTKR